MPEAYQVHDGQFVIDAYAQSAVNGLTVLAAVVPAGKVWTVIAASMYPDAPETRTVHFSRVTRSGQTMAITIPVEIALSATIQYPLLTQGNELKLYQGERLRADRSVAAAGSTFFILFQYIETDMPLYRYEEPQKEKMRQTFKRGIATAVSGITAPAAPSRPGGIGRPPTPPREK